ncbi:alpha/beta fold hydrolase [Hydrogenophaga sp. OTU3427]|uniref:alpha/beta fold hydrolase n=1 Tax=Hydrogenophaga sp. OTU3427 TaxID=3043856 RepID=UPI00313E7675
MYQALRPSRSEFLPLRHLRYHLRHWGTPRPGVAPLLLVHGWMDVSASFQFMVDALREERWIVAPDWRGYGLTEGPPTDNHWFPDYLADLDHIVDHVAGGQAIDLVGHSMGGNVAMMYAGVRPDRVRRLVNLEGFGMPATRPAQAPERYAQWMDQLKALQRGELAMGTYDDASGVAGRLMKTNPRLDRDKAEWLARHWAAPRADGRWAILGDAAHKVVNAQLYRVEEAQAVFQRIRAPLLAVESSDKHFDVWWKGRYTLAEYHERLQAVAEVRIAQVDNAGHMLHHDQPAVLAALIEDFLV